jgi:hypothetical protein
VRARLGIGLAVALSAVGIAACGGGERQDEDEPEGEFPVEIVSAEFADKQRLAQTSDLTLQVSNSGDETIPDLAVTVFTDADTDVDVTEDAEPGAEEEEAVLGEETEGSEEESEDEETTTEEELQPEAKGAFSVISEQPDLAIPSRPVWILEQGYPQCPLCPKLASGPGNPPPGEIAAAGGAEAVQTNTFSFGEIEPGDTVELVWRVTPVQAGTYAVHYRLAAGLQGKAVAVTEDGSVPEGEFVVQISDVPPQTRVDESGKVVPIQKSDIIGQAGSEEQRAEVKP